MHGFINSPALARLVALQMVEEQMAQSRRQKRSRPARTPLRVRLSTRRTARGAATPAPAQRVPAGKLAEETR